MFKSITGQLLDLFLPRRCVGCRRYDTWACESCLAQQRLPQVAGSEWEYISRVCTVGSYNTPFWREAVTALKFSGVRELAWPLGEELAAVAEKLVGVEGMDPVLLPVPLHARRLRERGYNQAQLLAEVVSQVTGWRLYDGLVTRSRCTLPQVRLEDSERAVNVASAFSLSPDPALQRAAAGKAVLIVDDVVTTGATAAAMAGVLQRCNPLSVSVLAIARGR